MANAKQIITTASKLADALWGNCTWFKGFDDINKGVYDGTSIPLRKVSADAIVVLHVATAGGYVTDSDGGWIADRFGPEIGARDVRRASSVLSA